MSGPARLRTLRVPDRPAQPLARLLAALEGRGCTVAEGGAEDARGATLVAGPAGDGTRFPSDAAGCARVLVVSLLGAHPDARAPLLRSLWRLEEDARASGLPVLTVRLGPLVGPGCPLWGMFATRPALPRGGRHLLCPVVEEDVVESLDRALAEMDAWSGWYEACGSEPLTMAELSALAGGRPVAGAPAPAWEPALEVLLEQRLAESRPWLERFGLAPGPIARRAEAWAA